MVKLVLRLLPFFYMIAIWIMSSRPANALVELPDLDWDAFIKESLHLVEFAILYVLLVLALLTVRGLSPTLNLVCLLIASLYGIIDEIHQSFVPYRSATMIDVVKDIIGVLVASWVVYGAYQNKRFPKLGKQLQKLEAASKRK
ncbi:VanZ family protein [Bacillus sp. V3B]|nr:VanZ family protein [Bacillus sp. V3B]